MDDTWIATKLCDVQTTKSGVCGITVDNNGVIYFTTHSENVYQVRPDNINTEPQVLVNIRWTTLLAIVWNGNNILYICDNTYHRILSYSIDTGDVSTLAGTTKGYKDGNVKDAQFSYPQGIAMDRNGDLYITEDSYVRKINFSSGTVITIAGCDIYGHKDGDAKQAMFNSPFGIAVSDDSTIYVADSRNHCIRKIKDGIVSTVAGIPRKMPTLPRPINPQFGEKHLQIKLVTRKQKLLKNELSQYLENSRALVLDVDGNLLIGDGEELRIVDDVVSTILGVSTLICSLAISKRFGLFVGGSNW